MQIRRDSPVAADVLPVVLRHLDFCRAVSPPESVHAMAPEMLAGPDVSFFAGRLDGVVVAIGALKPIGSGHVELKSMHVPAERRGQGFAPAMLGFLLDRGRGLGATRASLETGATDHFLPARRLYLRAGFVPCGPFGTYRADPHSAFFTREL